MKPYVLVERADGRFEVGRVTGLGTVEVIGAPYDRATAALDVVRTLNGAY